MSGAFEGERAVVVGAGASGLAAAAALVAEGAEVRVSEARPPEDLAWTGAAGPPPAGAELLAGGHRPEHLDGATLVVVSPGVPPTAPILGWARERGLPVWGELELGARLCRVPYVGVTGTNGKTTTTEIVAAAMREAGLAARACGNVGYAFSTAARESFDALAVEASSFQLAMQERFHPRVSVLLNLAPDHLDWHGSVGAYGAAKARIFARQGAGDVHVGCRDDAAAAAISETAPCEVRWFRGGPAVEGEVGVEDGTVVAIVEGERRPLGRPSVPGPLVLDAAAAAAAALAFGVPHEAIARAIVSFAPSPHRGQVVAEVGGVVFVDDSKATNPHAALAAIDARAGAPIVLIAGGLAKGVDLAPLATAAPRLSAVVALGEAAPEIERVFGGLPVPVQRVGSLEEAVEAAFDRALPAGTVLLAPGCASMDMFRDYADRGERFAAAARTVGEREGARSASGASSPATATRRSHAG